MRASAIALALAPLGLSACWPHIKGSWDDWAAPESAVFVGNYSQTHYVGDYWADGSPTGDMWWGGFEDPQDAFAWQYYATEETGCSMLSRDPDWFDELAAIGSGTSTIASGESTAELEWNSNFNLFYGTIPENALDGDATWELRPVTLDGYPAFDLEEFVTVPPDLEWEAPDLGGSQPAPMDGGDQEFAWTAPEEVETVLITMLLVSASSDPLEQISCLVENTGSFTVPAEAMWDDFNAGYYVYVRIGSYAERNDKVAFSEGGSRMGAWNAQQGAAIVEGR